MNYFITHPFKLYQTLKFCIIKGVATWVTGRMPLLSPLSRLVGVISATSSTHIPPFCLLSIIREWRAAKMVMAISAHFELKKMIFRNLRVTSRTVHPCFLQCMVLTDTQLSQVKLSFIVIPLWCGYIQWNETLCLTGPRCYINTDIHQWSKRKHYKPIHN